MKTATDTAVRAVLFIALCAILAPLILAAVALIAGSARAADVATCHTITDADARTYCLAKARSEPGMCYAVTKPDLRSQCLAEVRK